jgi:soluble lytic murein transglycosylase-like protein
LASSDTPGAISDLVDQSARAHNVDPLLVHSIIKVESNYNANAVSPKGAEGLMQLTPPTARMLGVSNSFDPGENIEAGVKYLKSLQDLYKDDRLALAAYNAGPGAVDKYKWIPPYPETQKYVENVGKRYEAARQAAAAKTEVKADAVKPEAAPADPAGAKQQEEKYSTLQPFVDEYGRLHLTTAP